ncbi:MAG TPA: sigma factor [Opitutus sp.]|nr:sigma factor [Opitutus sp.]
MNDDPALLLRYASDRSEAAFADLVRRHLPLVFSAALRRLNGDVHRARDVTQIVFTALARDAARLSRHPTLAGSTPPPATQ